MPESKKTLYKIGERVKILHAKGVIGRIVELRGPLGPKGMQIYRVRLRKKPPAEYVEVREDQLETVEAVKDAYPNPNGPSKLRGKPSTA